MRLLAILIDIIVCMMPLEGTIVNTAVYRIPYSYGDEIHLRPLFDLHIGHKLCNERKLRQYMANSPEGSYFVMGGDILDSVIIPDKRYSKSADASASGAIVDDQIDRAYEILKPYRERILSAIDGNHEQTIIKSCGTNPTKRLCELLSTDSHKVDYLGTKSVLKLMMHDNMSRIRTVKVYMHHGSGGGAQTAGGDLTKYERKAMDYNMDIFLYGHTHGKDIHPIIYYDFSGDNLITKRRLICVCGTYLESNKIDSGVDDYAEAKDLRPKEIGGIDIGILPKSIGFDLWGTV